MLVLVATTGITAALHVGPAAALFADPGVEECKAIASDNSGKTAEAASASSSDSTLTQAEYRKVRKQFAGSRHADIRTAGTHFVDLVWQVEGSMTGSDEEQAGAALAFIGPLVNAYSDLSGACANHGVVLPPLTSK